MGPESAKKTIALRADMDALPIEELTGLPFASEVPGRMHACGHDSHTAVLLGIMKVLKSMEDKLTCRVKFIFQPAEEGYPSGAETVVKNGFMDDVDEILAIHIQPDLSTGKIAINKTCMDASCHSFTAKVYGKKAHVSSPQSGVDAIAIANRFYMSLQEMRAREINPFEPLIINVGAMNGGTAPNIICDYVEMAVTVRTHNDAVDRYVARRVEELAEAASMGQTEGRVEIVWEGWTPSVHNDPEIADRLINVSSRLIGAENVCEKELQMSSEDFSFYLQGKKGARFGAGTLAPGKEPVALHNGRLDLDEDYMPVAAKILIAYVFENMEK